MSPRADEALAKVHAELEALEGIVRTTSDADWSKPCPGEDWPVALVAFHIARAFQRQAEFVEDAQAGRGPHQFDWGDTHALNAGVAAEHPAPSKDEVVALGTKSVERIASVIDGLADADLDRVAFVYDGKDRSVLWVVGTLAVRHARGHRESIAAALS